MHIWAQGGDTPITITGQGSLAMQSAVPWTNYSAGGYSRTHPFTAKSVTKVVVRTSGRNYKTITYSGEKCSVVFSYENTVVTFATGDDGKKLRVDTNFDSFHQAGADTTILVHNHFTSSITQIKVLKGAQVAFDSNAAASIVIHYQ